MGNSANKNYSFRSSSNSVFSDRGKISKFNKALSVENLSDRLHSNNSRVYSISTTNKSYRERSNHSLRHSKTIWPSPCTDLLFLSHFKRQSRNNEFNVINVISQGGFGIVFKVSEKRKPLTKYALKVFKKSKVLEQTSVDQVKAEVNIQKICSHHPFIVKQFDSWQDRGQLYILSEYISGGEIFNILCNFPTELVKIYVSEIAIALDFLHNAGIIYRDIKPENILLSFNYHIKLTDFGLSKWLKLGDRTNTICGTRQYMAPEILRGESYGHAVDWWSLGIVACRMLTNKYPNLGTDEIHYNNNEDLQLECHNKFDSVQYLPKEIETICSEGKDLIIKLLAYDYKMRVKSIFGLQRLAMFKNFKIDLNSLQKISPIDIIKMHKSSVAISGKSPTEWAEF